MFLGDDSCCFLMDDLFEFCDLLFVLFLALDPCFSGLVRFSGNEFVPFLEFLQATLQSLVFFLLPTQIEESIVVFHAYILGLLSLKARSGLKRDNGLILNNHPLIHLREELFGLLLALLDLEDIQIKLFVGEVLSGGRAIGAILLILEEFCDTDAVVRGVGLFGVRGVALANHLNRIRQVLKLISQNYGPTSSIFQNGGLCMLDDKTELCDELFVFKGWNLQYSMIRQESTQQKQWQQQNVLSYQSKKLLHMIELQILDIESTLHYIQKKHTMHQLKQALSQIYNIFNETEPLFRTIKGLFLHQEFKKIMNCFGIIYVILMDHLEKGRQGAEPQILQLENIKKEPKEQASEIFKASKMEIDNQNGQQKSKSKPLGGIFLYNQQYSRHLQSQEPFRKLRSGKLQTVFKEPSRQELNRMVVEEINDNSHLSTPSDQILDIFSFKFKYGKESQVVTFHDELLSIANFFKQSQNEAFEFLNKTKDQTSIITYNDSFKDIMNQIKKEKQEKLKIFNDRIKSAFGSIKSKTEKKMVEMENKLIYMEETQHRKEINKHDRQVQTIFNVDEQIKSLKRRLADSQEKYRIMMQIKKKELEENTMIGLELQSEISIKNREIVYLRLNVEENSLLISNLNKRIKFLTESNRKIKDIVKNADQPSKIMDVVNNKEDADKFLKEQADDEMALEALRKQRKMAKKILLEKRKSSLLPGQKATYMKRFTQQLDSAKMTPNHLLSRNLSEINEGEGSQAYEEDSYSIASNKNNLLSQEFARPYQRRKTKKVSIVPDSRGEDSSHSIKSRQSLTNKSKKVLKQKHASQIVEISNRTSLLNKIKDTPRSINQDSIQDQCSDQENEQLDGIRGEKLSINAEDYNKIEEMFKKQMNRTKNIINNNKRFSSFNVNNNKNTTKSIFSSQKQNTQESVPSSQIISKATSRSKSSFRNSRQEEENRSIHRLSKKMQSQQGHSPQYGNSVEGRGGPSVKKDSIRQFEPRRLNLYSSQYNIAIYEPVQKTESFIQTQQKKVTEPNSDSSSPQISPIVFSNNTIHISKTKDAIFEKENTASSQLITRSATQSKMLKNRHLKTLYSGASKQNQKYFFPKHTQKSIDDEFKNSHSCLEMQENVHKELQQIVAQKRDTAYEQTQKVKEDREIRKLAIKCRTLQEFKARVAEMHKQKCGHTCKHLQKFVQNYIRYKQQSKPKIRMPIKNLCDNIAFTTLDQQQKNYFPMLQKKRN